MSFSWVFCYFFIVEQVCQKLEFDLEDLLELFIFKDKKGQLVWKKGVLCYVCCKGCEIQYMYEMLVVYFCNGMVVFDEWIIYVWANLLDWQIDIVNNYWNYGLEVFFVCYQIMWVFFFFICGDMIVKIIFFKIGESELEYWQFWCYSCVEQLWKVYEWVLVVLEINKWVQYYEIIDV